MPAMTAMFTRTRVRAGKNMTTEAGTACRSRRQARKPLLSNERRDLSSSGHRLPNIRDGANRWRDCKRRHRTGKGVSNRASVSSNFSGPVAREAGEVAASVEEEVAVDDRDDCRAPTPWDKRFEFARHPVMDGSFTFNIFCSE